MSNTFGFYNMKHLILRPFQCLCKLKKLKLDRLIVTKGKAIFLDKTGKNIYDPNISFFNVY